MSLVFEIEILSGKSDVMKNKILNLSSVAPAALFAVLGSQVWAGSFDDAPAIAILGDGLVFVDVDEGILDPGLKSVTTTINADYPNTTNPSGIENCLMANNPLFVCTSPPGSGKRIKTRLTGRSGMDMVLGTQATGGITEYFYYGKTSNLSGARIESLIVQFGTGSGDSFVAMDTSDPAAAALFDSDFISKFNLPDGLFGDGGQESTGIGFFDDQTARMTINLSDPATLEALNLANATYQSFFGDAILDDTMIPDAYFWDASGTPLESDEPIPVAWYNVSTGQWQYGNMGVAVPSDPTIITLDVRLQELAISLGVDVADLDYASGVIPPDIALLMEQNGLFEVLPLEDLRNLNLNFIIDLGDVDGNQVTIRLVPTFAPIVTLATSEYQFLTAAHLDAAANVPYLNLGNGGIDGLYQTTITALLGMSDVDRADALESIGFSFLPAYSSLGFEFARSQGMAFGDEIPSSAAEGEVVSRSADAATWSLGQNLNGMVSLQGGQASYGTSANNIGYDIVQGSFSAGVESRLNENHSFGLLIGGFKGSATAYSDRGEIDATGWSLAAFGKKAFENGGRLKGIIGYQSLSYDSSRLVLGQTAVGNTSGSQFFAAVDGDYMFQRGKFAFGPMASVEYYDLSVEAFDETGAGAWNLSVGEQTGSLLLGSVGIRGEYNLPNASSDLSLEGSLAYTVASRSESYVETGFVGLPGASIPVNGFEDSWLDLDLSVAMDMSSARGPQTQLMAGYHGSFSENYESHGLQVSMNMAF